ncbi:hypothetical protein ACGFX8_35580 [Streptomyces sp. NPDC048362]|uniref:hypothetical protein n=1 Tax=Streptomyces sp. NPDC048362 TaxID=3365539 RepID=UPI003717E740
MTADFSEVVLCMTVDESNINYEQKTKPDLDDEKEDARRVLLIMSIFLLCLAVLLLYTIFCLWPTPVPTPIRGNETRKEVVSWFGVTFTVRHDQLALLLVLLSGALGGTLKRISRISHIRTIPGRVPPIYTYITMPFIGSMLAFITYLIIQAGFMAPSNQSTYIDPFQIAGMAALTGLFAEEASRKLESVFNTWSPKKSDARKP